MKSASALTAAIISLLLYSCNKQYDNFLHNKNKQRIIALQPLGDYDSEQLNFISKEIGSFYNRKVIILKPINIPATFRLTKDDELYSADSILEMLSEILNDEIIEIIGLTHKEIYTILKEKNNKTKNPLFDYRVHSIFGLGYLPGNSCVISDYRLKSTDTVLLKHRLRTVIIHEMGHNIGLQHCTVDQCIMSDQNAKFSVLDNCGKDYCNNCKRKLED